MSFYTDKLLYMWQCWLILCFLIVAATIPNAKLDVATSPTACVQPPPARSPSPAAPATERAAHPVKPAIAPLGKDSTVPIVGIRKAMSKAMVRALQIPHFGYDDEVGRVLHVWLVVLNTLLTMTCFAIVIVNLMRNKTLQLQCFCCDFLVNVSYARTHFKMNTQLSFFYLI